MQKKMSCMTKAQQGEERHYNQKQSHRVQSLQRDKKKEKSKT